MYSLTVFTPTYNRLHTLKRTFQSLLEQTETDFMWLVVDDGSTDNTREWITSLGSVTVTEGSAFTSMGLLTGETTTDHFTLLHQAGNRTLQIEYIYKPNGGLYTGYNTAYQSLHTPLVVCIDSDDFMPPTAVEKILTLWREKGGEQYAGIEGLDFDIRTNQPIGGYFPKDLQTVYLHELWTKKIHLSDTKQAMRSDLMRAVAPQIGYEGEKNFNPVYMLLQVCDRYPLLVINDNLCTVEYQTGGDSMSAAIFHQYRNSPHSFAKMRRLELSLVHNTLKDRFRSAIHYVSSSLLSGEGLGLSTSPRPVLTWVAVPFGCLLYGYILYKTRR